MNPDLASLEKRLGRLHARQRLGMEAEHKAQASDPDNLHVFESFEGVREAVRRRLAGVARGGPSFSPAE